MVNLLFFYKKIAFLFLFTISIFFSQVSFADVMPPRYPSRSIDFTSQYVFIATDYGINAYDKKNKRWEAISFKIPKIQEKDTILETDHPYYYPIHSFLAVEVYNDEVWFGGYKKGAYKYDLKTGEMIHYEAYHMVYNDATRRKERRGNCELLDNVVNSILVDKRKNVWFATKSGVSKLTNNVWKSYLSRGSFDLQKKEAIFGGSVTCMDMDGDGNIWFGRSDFHYAYYESPGPPEMIVDGGISVFDGKNWTHYYAKDYDLENPDKFHIKTELISNDVSCLAIDNDEIWIGTSKGISVYNKKTKKWKSYTTENSGIISNNIASITVGEDAIWIATDSGISKYHKITNKWTNYGKDVLPALNIRSIGYDIYDKSIWAITSLYADVDIYVYRFDGINWTIFPTRKRVYPQNEQELLKLGIFLKRGGVKEEAKAVFSEIRKKYPTSKESIQAEYEILTFPSEKVDLNSLIEFKKKYPESPFAIKIQFKIAEHYHAQGDYQRAIEEYNKFIEQTQDLQEIYDAKWGIAECYKRLNDYQGEINAWLDLYNSFSGVNEVFRQRTEYIPAKIAKIYMNQLKDYKKAIEWFEVYLQKRKAGSPDETILGIGRCYELLGENERAIETYKRIPEGSWRFNEAKKKIIELENKLGIKKNYPIKVIELDKFNEDFVWFVDEGGGVWKYNKKTKDAVNFTIGTIIKDILITKRYVWVKSEKGINQINKTTNEMKHFDYLGDIAYDGQNVWMVNFRDVKYRHRIEGKEIEFTQKETVSLIKYNEVDDTMQEFASDTIRLPRDYNYKIIPDGKYVWAYGGKYLTGYNVENNVWDKYGQAEYYLKYRANDEKFLWFDTDGHIYRFDKTNQSWELFPRIIHPMIFVTDKYVWLFMRFTDNIVRYDKRLNEFKKFSPSKFPAFPAHIVLVGQNLYGIFNEGIFRFDESIGDWKEKYPAPCYFPYPNFRFLTIKDESIWFVYVEYSYDLYKFDTIRKKWFKFTLPLSNIQNLTINKECVWLISDDKVFKYDLTTMNIEEVILSTHRSKHQMILKNQASWRNKIFPLFLKNIPYVLLCACVVLIVILYTLKNKDGSSPI